MGETRKAPPFCETPIDPPALAAMKAALYKDPAGFTAGKKVIPTQCASVKRNVFAALLELAGTIYSGLDFDKKGRIVLEYDPQEEKFEVVTFQEAEEIDTDINPGEMPSFLLRREDR